MWRLDVTKIREKPAFGNRVCSSNAIGTCHLICCSVRSAQHHQQQQLLQPSMKSIQPTIVIYVFIVYTHIYEYNVHNLRVRAARAPVRNSIRTTTTTCATATATPIATVFPGGVWAWQ